MAGRGGVQNKRRHILRVHDIEDGCDQGPGVKRDCLTGFEVNFRLPFFLHFLHKINQPVHIIVIPRDVVAAAHVDPGRLAKVRRKMLLHAPEGFDEGFDALLTERMKMQPAHPLWQLLRHLTPADPEPRARRAGIVDRVPFLGRVFGVDAERGFYFPGCGERLPDVPVGLKLSQGVKIEVGCDPAELTHLIFLVGRLEDMVLRMRIRAAPEFLVRKTGLEDAGRGRPGEIFRDQRIDGKH